MHQTILFQGDSITDAHRTRDNDFYPGSGYSTMIQGQLGLQHPGKYRFINRGISGNRIVDLYARMKSDIINLEPDVVSILIGVNDVWHELDRQNGVEASRFERVYDMLICDLKEAMPECRLILMEPFVLPGSATAPNEEHWERFYHEVQLRAEAVQRLAQKHELTFIPLQNKLNEACTRARGAFWLYDGVHPTVAGHALIAQAWMEKF